MFVWCPSGCTFPISPRKVKKVQKLLRHCGRNAGFLKDYTERYSGYGARPFQTLENKGGGISLHHDGSKFNPSILIDDENKSEINWARFRLIVWLVKQGLLEPARSMIDTKRLKWINPWKKPVFLGLHTLPKILEIKFNYDAILTGVQWTAFLSQNAVIN